MEKKNYIRFIRELRGLSQANLAEKMGISQSQVDRLEKGQRKLTVDWVVKFSEALDTSFGSILNGPGKLSDPEILGKSNNTIEIHATIPSMSSINFFMLDSIRYKIPTPRGIKIIGNQKFIKAFEVCDGSLSERYMRGDFVYYSIESNFLEMDMDSVASEYFRCPFIVFVGSNECFSARLLEYKNKKLRFTAETPNGKRESFYVHTNKIVSMYRIFEWEEVLYGARRVAMYQLFEDAVEDFNAK